MILYFTLNNYTDLIFFLTIFYILYFISYFILYILYLYKYDINLCYINIVFYITPVI